MPFLSFFFSSPFFLFHLLELISFDKFNFFDDESDDDGSGSGSPSTYAFPFCSGKSVVIVSGVGSSDYVPTGIDSIGDFVQLFMFLPRGVESKGGGLIEIFCRPKY